MTASHRSLLSAALCIAILTGALGGDEGEPAFSQETANKNHPADLPRFPFKNAAELRRAISVRPGFRVQLAAAEPLVRSPVAIDFDEDGRLYVAEFPEYNQYANPKYTAKAVSACWRTATETACTIRARSSPPTCRWPRPLPAGTAACTSAPRPICFTSRTQPATARPTSPGCLHRLRQRPSGRGDAQLVSLGARQPLSCLDQPRWRQSARPPARCQDCLGPRPRLSLRPARRDVRCDQRRRAARHEHGRLGPYLCMRQQRPVSPGDVRQPLLRPQPVAPGAPRSGEHRPGRQVHQIAPHQSGRAVASAADATAKRGARARVRRRGLTVGLFHRRHRRDGLPRRRFSARVSGQSVCRGRLEQCNPSRHSAPRG